MGLFKMYFATNFSGCILVDDYGDIYCEPWSTLECKEAQRFICGTCDFAGNVCKPKGHILMQICIYNS